MSKLFLCALMAAAGVSACDKSSTAPTEGSAPPSVQASQEDAGSAFDRQFIDMTVPHHEEAIMMAEIAERRAEHAEIKAMARTMREDQQRENGELKGMRKQWFGSDATPSMDKMPMLPGMKEAPKMDAKATRTHLESAAPFDRAFVDMMIDHHRMAIEAADLLQQKGKHEELKQLARKMSDAQKQEKMRLESMRKEWYGVN